LMSAADFVRAMYIEGKQVLVFGCVLVWLWAGRGSWVGSVGYWGFREIK
jgi:hypothetical protein